MTAESATFSEVAQRLGVGVLTEHPGDLVLENSETH
jgi:hypothetical protein